ncbi:MAG: hypothetical protein U0610_11380 [bacterium]
MNRPAHAALVLGWLALAQAGCPPTVPPSAGPGIGHPSTPPPAPALPPSPVPSEGTSDCRRARALATRAERLAEPSERVHVLEQAAAQCDDDATLLRDLGSAYRDAGNRTDARRALLRARALDPSDTSIGELLDSLGP